MEEHFM
jgi:hypothetical protein